MMTLKINMIFLSLMFIVFLILIFKWLKLIGETLRSIQMKIDCLRVGIAEIKTTQAEDVYTRRKRLSETGRINDDLARFGDLPTRPQGE